MITPLHRVDLLVEGRARAVYLKLEGKNPGGSIKDRTARGLVDSLEARELLGLRSILVESTSGNLGVGLAIEAKRRGIGLLAVIDPKVSRRCRAAMLSLGARIDVVDRPDRNGSFLAARLERVGELIAADDRLVWTDQYSNPANPAAHRRETGPQIIRQSGGLVDAVFAAVSTGGTLAGVGACLRERQPGVSIVGVDAQGSVVGGGEPGPRRLVGIGSSRPSSFLRPGLVDEWAIVSDGDAFSAARLVARRTGVRLGGSSGAVLSACARYLASHPEVRFPICLCADGGDRYVDTFYRDGWLASEGVGLAPPYFDVIPGLAGSDAR